MGAFPGDARLVEPVLGRLVCRATTPSPGLFAAVAQQPEGDAYPRPRWPRRLAASLAAIVLTVAACGGDDDDNGAAPATTSPTLLSSSTSSTTTATSSSGTAVTDDEAEAATAYEAATTAFIDAAAIPDPDHLSLATTHTGPMLEQRRKTLRALQADGRIIRYPPSSQYRVDVLSVEIEGDVARLTFCSVDDGERVVKATGEVISSGVISVRGRAAMRLENGTWKLAEQLFDVRQEGAEGCVRSG